MFFEFLIPKRPVSLQTRNKNNLRLWKAFVRTEARKRWTGVMRERSNLHLSLVYLCDTDPVDVDNIIKPIQDALVGLVYDDDILVSDVEAHRRPLTGSFDITKLPNLLLDGLIGGEECVYVTVSQADALEDYL